MNLIACPPEELERLYASTAPARPLSGRWLGRHLGFFDTPGARRPEVRVLDTLLFVWPSFGIDFDRKLWWFLDPRVGAGRFRVEPGRSRWREAEVLRMFYDPSRLPGPLRRLLYDEVKPLDEQTALGIGGISAERGQGDHFFFELRRMRSTGPR